MMKKNWEKPAVMGLGVQNTENDDVVTLETSEYAIINGRCTACGATGITVGTMYAHRFIISAEYTGYACKRVSQS